MVVFYTQAHCWQFRFINDDSAVFGEQKLYYTPSAALTAGRDWICFGDEKKRLTEEKALLDLWLAMDEIKAKVSYLQPELSLNYGQMSLNLEIDALIAAVARSRDDILVTNNIKDFINIPNLKLDKVISDKEYTQVDEFRLRSTLDPLVG